ncbi:hypothetical protein ACJIZ3_014312 [Penstemon smallii]|uniref:Uncharacterized protein n=1 Tax=Penstemon smallii TaxID=265156 RepID=A0ABD3RJZ2_9LAMI
MLSTRIITFKEDQFYYLIVGESLFYLNGLKYYLEAANRDDEICRMNK